MSGSITLATTLALCALIAGFDTASAEVAEPSSFWTGPMRGEVPATLTGGHVIGTEELARLVQSAEVVLVDAAAPESRPKGLPPDVFWSAPAHPAIEGSVWLPGIGAGEVGDASNDFFRQELARLAENSFDRPIVLYCHPRCWASWNAAKRAIGYGYTNVYWYPEGVEGWQDAGKPLAVAAPRVPALDAH